MSRCAVLFLFFFQAEDGIRDLVRSRGLGDVYKRQRHGRCGVEEVDADDELGPAGGHGQFHDRQGRRVGLSLIHI